MTKRFIFLTPGEGDLKVLRPESGTPQDGIISPVLATCACTTRWICGSRESFSAVVEAGVSTSLCRRLCLRLWASRRGPAVLQRVGRTLRKFGLELAGDKTRVIPFSRYRQGETSFEFLGFEFRWGVNRKGQCVAQATHRTKEVARLTETGN